jgi:hypothetical protein
VIGQAAIAGASAATWHTTTKCAWDAGGNDQLCVAVTYETGIIQSPSVLVYEMKVTSHTASGGVPASGLIHLSWGIGYKDDPQTYRAGSTYDWLPDAIVPANTCALVSWATNVGGIWTGVRVPAGSFCNG